MTAKWARLILALAAATSTIALVADNRNATAVFSIITAVVAATNVLQVANADVKHDQANLEIEKKQAAIAEQEDALLAGNLRVRIGSKS